MKKTLVFLLTLIVFVICTSLVVAQSVELAISPPLTEIVIKPGVKVTQRYLVSNFSTNDVVLKPSLYRLSAKDDLGTPEIANEPEGTDSPVYNWFTVGDNSLDESLIRIRQGQTIEVPVSITPASDANQIDYYLSLAFTTDPTLNINSTGQSATAAIATNLLISLSESGLPQKNARIVEFDVPRIIDSFARIKTNIVVENTGNSFFKPIGVVEYKGLFLDTTTQLAAQNILSGTQRRINCLDAEELASCDSKGGFYLGKYTTKVVFNLDEDGKELTQTQEVFAFPFLLTFVSAVGFAVIRKVKKRSGAGQKQAETNS